MEEKEIRKDGYMNILTKYGTSMDSSERYAYESEAWIPDEELTIHYEGNGLFTKIIDEPAEEAVKHGYEYGIHKQEIEQFIEDSLDELEFEEKAVTAIKWARLYGGALMVMLIDDGRDLAEPVDWDKIKGIDELLVFERPLITPDYNTLYDYKPNNMRGFSKFGMPEYYTISSVYGGTFRVHESRCLLFKNGVLPSVLTQTNYRFFGMPEYIRIRKDLQNTITSHGNGVKLLDRAVQAIYKMKDLAQHLETEDGEDTVIKRLQLIDMARGIINSIAIDADGEDYDFKSISFAGVKDIVDSTCNMLSAVTNIPQTVLFGRSPAGQNSTGESDSENYYNYVARIQRLMLKNNLRTLIDVILAAGKYKGEFDEIPKYKLTFKPLWSLSEAESATVEQTKAATELTKAQTMQAYIDMQALDVSEVRKKLSESGAFTIQDVITEEDWLSEEETEDQESNETSDTALSALNKSPNQKQQDSVEPTGVGVIVVKDGKVLCGERKDGQGVCGPGGHIEKGETPEVAAIRESFEEFGIEVKELIPIVLLGDMPKEYCPSQVFLCTDFINHPTGANDEIENARFKSLKELRENTLFLPFQLSIDFFTEQLNEVNVGGIIG